MRVRSMPEVYQLHVWLRKISPMISRRFLVRDDTSIADLHQMIQVSMGWSGTHLHKFFIRGKEYGVSYEGGIIFNDNPETTYLKDFRFREKERFFYEYDFFDSWEHEIRVEKKLDVSAKTKYPKCISGSRAAPPEDCGGPFAFMELEDNYSPCKDLEDIFKPLLSDSSLKVSSIDKNKVKRAHYWLTYKQFSPGSVNSQFQSLGIGSRNFKMQEQKNEI